MGAMAVKDKEPPSPLSFLLCAAIKNLLKPGKAKLII
jgi:hypothetical protein